MLVKIILVACLFGISLNGHKANAEYEFISDNLVGNFDLIGKNKQKDYIENYDLSKSPNIMDIIQVMSNKLDSRTQNYEKR